MTRQNIGIGSSANDGNGDTLRTAGSKINANFREIYTFLADSNNLSTQISLENDAVVFEGSSTDDFETRLKVTDPTKDNIITLPDSTGTVTLDNTIQTLTVAQLQGFYRNVEELITPNSFTFDDSGQGKDFLGALGDSAEAAAPDFSLELETMDNEQFDSSFNS